MASKGMEARLAAAALLHGVLFEKRSMADLTGRQDSAFMRLKPQEKARAQSLAANVLRHLEPIDVVVNAFLDKPPPLKVRNALRMAAVEMLVDGIAAHAAVDAAVEITRAAQKTMHLTGLTNAVARKIAKDGPAMWADHQPQTLAPWLAKPVKKNYGKDAIAAIEVAHAKGGPTDLTFASDAARDELVGQLQGEVLPNGSFRLSGNYQVSALPGYEDGKWWVQDAAATLPARLLGDVSGQSVLDICAAPGGKTMQLAAAGANVTALDISEFRLKRVRENLARTRLKATIVEADALTWESDQRFDSILLDAPCSATGTIRRHPDLPFAKMGVDMSPLFDLQSALLDQSVSLLKPGGRLIYCTCSLLPREGERQIVDVLDRHKGLSVQQITPQAFGLDPDWLTVEGGLRLRPDYWQEHGGMDGFYMAILQNE